MKKIFIPVIIMLMMLALAACGSKEPDTSDSGQNENAYAKADVNIAYADEEFLASSDAFDEFIDYPSEYQVKAVFSADTAKKDFKFLKLSFVDADEGGNMKFNIDEELYTADELLPQRPLVIGMTLAGTIPDRGISYADEDGNTKYYAIITSGKDGSLLLTEFKK